MRSNQPKLKTNPTSQLFSCGFFRHCTQSVLSPTTTAPPPLPHAPSPPPPPSHVIVQAAQPNNNNESSSSSSSNNTSQSFTQWKFPLANSPPVPINNIMPHGPSSRPNKLVDAPPIAGVDLEELYNDAELRFESGSYPERAEAVQSLERAITCGTRTAACPPAVVAGVTACLREGVARRPASKVLLALCLEVENRPAVVDAGAVAAVVEALADADANGAAVERSLAALELLCTTEEGAGEVRAHALAVPMMVQVMGRADGRGKEHAISLLAVIYGGLEDMGTVAPPREVARAVTLALQGECSARGRRKGGQLLKILQENGRLDLIENER